MKAYPLELHHIRFIDVSIQARPPMKGKPWPRPFDFEGVNFVQNITISAVKHKDAPKHAFSIRFKNSINNDGEVQTPYDVVLEVVGIFSVNSRYEGNPEELALISGCGVLWSAMRDMLLSITIRSANGELLLPTATFHDLKDQPATTKAANKIRSKKTKTSSPNNNGHSAEGTPNRATAKPRAAKRQSPKI